MVTVAQLIEKLSSLPQDHVVLLSSDEEGNSFHLFSGDIDKGMYEDEESSIQFHSHVDKDDLFDAWGDPIPFIENSVVLWP